MPLTDTQIKGLRPTQSPTKHSDGGGLHLLVSPTGGKLWRLSYRHGGKQKTLAFGTPQEVREQVTRHCTIFSAGGGYVFNAVHNVQARTPVENIDAMFQAVHQFRGCQR